MKKSQKDFAFNAKELEMIALMRSLGLPKNLSKVLVYLSKAKEVMSHDIEKSVHLKQSEVSVILKRLRERGWLKSRTLKPEGKGRPNQLHKLTFSFRRVIRDIEQEKMKEVDEIKKKIATLKRLAK
jgi:predicted transcriptional regulator